MLTITRKNLISNPKFIDYHSRTIKTKNFESMCICAEKELRPSITSHPVADQIQLRALRDSYTQGVREVIDYFLTFQEFDPSSHGSDFEPLE